MHMIAIVGDVAALAFADVAPASPDDAPFVCVCVCACVRACSVR